MSTGRPHAAHGAARREVAFGGELPLARRSLVEHRLRPGPPRPTARTGDSGAAIVSGPVQGHRFLYRPEIGTPAADTQEREAAETPLMPLPWVSGFGGPTGGLTADFGDNADEEGRLTGLLSGVGFWAWTSRCRKHWRNTWNRRGGAALTRRQTRCCTRACA